jgi:archaellum component FlaG (FlaF/FlaG flagellin family)
MRTRLRSKATLLFIVVAVLVAVPVVAALADNLADSLTTSQGEKSIATGTANTWTNNYTVQSTGVRHS